jgi:large subunit ribosomal protein L25
MKTVSISGSPRENVGKKDAKKIRKEGKVPCVLYGGKDQVHFATEEISFKKLIYSPDVYTVKLDINNKEYEAVLQEIQYHPVSDVIIHADFLEIFPDKPVTIHIPVKVIGAAEGVLKGGQFFQKLRKVKIKALSKHLPDSITVDITPLEIGDSIRISDVKIDNVTFLDAPTAVIVGVRVTRVYVEETPEVVEGAVTAEGAAVPGAPGAPGAPATPGVPAKPGAPVKPGAPAAPGAPATPAAPHAEEKGKGKDKGKEKK